MKEKMTKPEPRDRSQSRGRDQSKGRGKGKAKAKAKGKAKAKAAPAPALAAEPPPAVSEENKRTGLQPKFGGLSKLWCQAALKGKCKLGPDKCPLPHVSEDVKKHIQSKIQKGVAGGNASQ